MIQRFTKNKPEESYNEIEKNGRKYNEENIIKRVDNGIFNKS